MTDMGVERGERKALPSFVRRAAARYALRGLVVAGIAGGTWLLWAAGAQAAPADAPGGSPITGGITELLAGTGSLSGAGLEASSAQAVTVTNPVLTTGVMSPSVIASLPVVVAPLAATSSPEPESKPASDPTVPAASTAVTPARCVERGGVMICASLPAATAVGEHTQRRTPRGRHSASPVGDRAGPGTAVMTRDTGSLL